MNNDTRKMIRAFIRGLKLILSLLDKLERGEKGCENKIDPTDK